MPRAAFRRHDVRRLISEARLAGMEVTGIKVDHDGNVTVLTARSADTQSISEADRWIADYERAHSN